MKTIDVTEKEITTSEDLFYSIKKRENESIIRELLEDRYGWAFENKKDIIGYVWAEHASVYGHYIIHYQIYNFPIDKLHVYGVFDFEDFEKSIDSGYYDYYTDETFDGVIEKLKINS